MIKLDDTCMFCLCFTNVQRSKNYFPWNNYTPTVFIVELPKFYIALMQKCSSVWRTEFSCIVNIHMSSYAFYCAIITTVNPNFYISNFISKQTIQILYKQLKFHLVLSHISERYQNLNKSKYPQFGILTRDWWLRNNETPRSYHFKCVIAGVAVGSAEDSVDRLLSCLYFSTCSLYTVPA